MSELNGAASLPRHVLQTGRVTFDVQRGEQARSFTLDLVEAYQRIIAIDDDNKEARDPFAHVEPLRQWISDLTAGDVVLTVGEADYLHDAVPGLFADFRRRRVERWFGARTSPSSTGSAPPG